LSVNGTKLCGEDIDVLKGLLKKEEHKLSFTIYNGDIASLHQDGAMVGKQKVSQKVTKSDFVLITQWHCIMKLLLK